MTILPERRPEGAKRVAPGRSRPDADGECEASAVSVGARRDGTMDFRRMYEMLRLAFTRPSPGQLRAEACPFCGGEKMYVSPQTGLWDCKSGSCRRSGNHLDLIRGIYEDRLQATTDEQYHWLRDKRGVSLQTLKRHGPAFDPGTACWLTPYKNRAGEVVNLQLYPQDGGPKRNLAGLPTYLFGLDKLSDDRGKILFLFEGFWDMVAFDHHVKNNRAKYDMLAIPGAFKQEWAQYFRDRKVRGVFDNDDGGEVHRRRVQNLLGETGVAAELRTVRWPPGFPTGCDVNDLVRNPALGVTSVAGWVQDNSVRVVAEPKLVFNRGRRAEAEDTPIDWVWPNRLRCGTYVSFSGKQGTFKSTIGLEMAARYSTGRPMPLEKVATMPAGSVLYVHAEDDRASVEDRFGWAGGDFALFTSMPAVVRDGDPLNILDNLRELEQHIREHGTRLVIIDGQNSVVGAPHIGTDMQARTNVTNKFHQFAQRLNVCLIGIRNEDADGRAYGPASMADIGRCVVRAVELPPIFPSDPPYCKLEFVKVSDAPRSKYPPIPYSVADRGGAHREILWGKVQPNPKADPIPKDIQALGKKMASIPTDKLRALVLKGKK